MALRWSLQVRNPWISTQLEVSSGFSYTAYCCWCTWYHLSGGNPMLVLWLRTWQFNLGLRDITQVRSSVTSLCGIHIDRRVESIAFFKTFQPPLPIIWPIDWIRQYAHRFFRVCSPLLKLVILPFRRTKDTERNMDCSIHAFRAVVVWACLTTNHRGCESCTQI